MAHKHSRAGEGEVYSAQRGPDARRRRVAERAASTTGARQGRNAREGTLNPALYDQYGLRRPKEIR